MLSTKPSTNGHTKVAQPDVVTVDVPPAPEPPRPKRSRLLPVVALLVAGVVAAPPAWHAVRFAETHEGTDDAFIDGYTVNVASRVAGPIVRLAVHDNELVHQGDVIAVVDPSDYQTQVDRAKAELVAAEKRLQSARIKVRVTRRTSSADVEQASSGVGAADSDAAAESTTVTTAETQVDTAQARVEQARQQVQVARRNADQAQAEVDAARAQVDNAHTDMVRFQALLGQDAVSQQDVDHATNAWRTADAEWHAAQKRQAAQVATVQDAASALQAAEHQVDQYQSQVGEARAKVMAAQAQIGQAQGRLSQAEAAPEQVALTQSDVEAAAADVRVAQAALQQARLNLSYTRIVAAEDGRVTRRAIEPGSYVQVGQPLMVLVSPNVWVTANFKETQLEHMRVGQPVDITVDAYPGHVFEGHVDSFQRGSGAAFSLLPPENATGNYVKVVQRIPVKIVFDQVPGGSYVLGPGMSVDPEVSIQR